MHLVSVDAGGDVGLLDLLDENPTDLGTIGRPSAVTTDGRYVFATTAEGLEIVDSGVWTWDHGDHFHYYRAKPQRLGSLRGSGPANVAGGPLSTAGGSGVFFAESGEAVLLDNEALADGEVRESFRLEVTPHDGIVAPFVDGAMVTVANDAGAVTGVQFHRKDGTPVDGVKASCKDARGTITTAVGLVIGCADGALLVTDADGEPAFERIRYPSGSKAPRATAFNNREGRPTVAALAGQTGIWLLDTREHSWQHVDAGAQLQRVSAADDDDGHVLALDRTGRVRVYSAESGEQLSVTDPLLPRTMRDPDLLAGIELAVDQQRAYLNAPAEGVVYEIDYADDARIARKLKTPTEPTFFAETGR